MGRSHSPNPDLGAIEHAIDTDISAFLTRTRGLSSEGIIEALAGAGKNSGWAAFELARMYDGTDETYYKQRIMAMIIDLMKQKEGQRIRVDEMSAASNSELASMERAVEIEIEDITGGLSLETQEDIKKAYTAADRGAKRLTTTKGKRAKKGKNRKSKKKSGDTR